MGDIIDIWTPRGIESLNVDERLCFLDSVVKAIVEKIESPEMYSRVYFEDYCGFKLFYKMYVTKGYGQKKRCKMVCKPVPEQLKKLFIRMPLMSLLHEERQYIEIVKE